jgi:hypothetical protein
MIHRLTYGIACGLLLSSCAHREALRVQCDGPLRPINQPAPVKGANPPASSIAPRLGITAPAGEGGHER